MKINSQTTCQTKNNITQCALKLFSELGFYKVTIAQICQSAHITRTAFYYYFNRKEDVLDYFFVHSIDGELLAENLYEPRTGTNYNLNSFFNFLYKYINRNVQAGPVLTGIFLSRLMTTSCMDLRPDRLAAWPSMLKLIKNASISGEINAVSCVDSLLSSFLSSVMGILISWCSLGGSFDLYANIRSSFDAIFRL